MSSSNDTRERLLDTAAELFYRQGITATGVDKIVALAGVCKPTLYAHFASKDKLVAAVLERRHSRRASTLDPWIRSHAHTPKEQILAIFDWLVTWNDTEEGERGCAFINAAAEIVGPDHPAREVARKHKLWMREYLASLAREMGCYDSIRLGSDLMLLIDGANARMTVEGDRTAALDAKRLAAVVIDAYQSRQA